MKKKISRLTSTPKVSRTPTTQEERMVLSGMFALSNMGQPMPKDTKQIIKDLLGSKFLTVESAMSTFCQRYMETDEHYQMFFKEAKWWYKDTFCKPKYTREEIARVWPDMAELMWSTGPHFLDDWSETINNPELRKEFQST